MITTAALLDWALILGLAVVLVVAVTASAFGLRDALRPEEPEPEPDTPSAFVVAIEDYLRTRERAS